MKPFSLSICFARQSILPALTLSQVLEHERGLVGLVEAEHYPAAGTLHLAGLRPERSYWLRGAVEGFSRATEDGTLHIDAEIGGPALLILAPVL